MDLDTSAGSFESYDEEPTDSDRTDSDHDSVGHVCLDAHNGGCGGLGVSMGGMSMGSVGGGSPVENEILEKTKQAATYLAQVLHCQECRGLTSCKYKESHSLGGDVLPSCHHVYNMCKHISKCQHTSCPIKGCLSTKKLLIHYKTCHHLSKCCALCQMVQTKLAFNVQQHFPKPRSNSASCASGESFQNGSFQQQQQQQQEQQQQQYSTSQSDHNSSSNTNRPRSFSDQVVLQQVSTNKSNQIQTPPLISNSLGQNGSRLRSSSGASFSSSPSIFANTNNNIDVNSSNHHTVNQLPTTIPRIFNQGYAVNGICSGGMTNFINNPSLNDERKTYCPQTINTQHKSISPVQDLRSPVSIARKEWGDLSSEKNVPQFSHARCHSSSMSHAEDFLSLGSSSNNNMVTNLFPSPEPKQKQHFQFFGNSSSNGLTRSSFGSGTGSFDVPVAVPSRSRSRANSNLGANISSQSSLSDNNNMHTDNYYI